MYSDLKPNKNKMWKTAHMALKSHNALMWGAAAFGKYSPAAWPPSNPANLEKNQEKKHGLIAWRVPAYQCHTRQEVYKEACSATWWKKPFSAHNLCFCNKHMRWWYLHVWIDAVLVNHGVQGIRVCWGGTQSQMLTNENNKWKYM